jgi:hypothetical protein
MSSFKKSSTLRRSARSLARSDADSPLLANIRVNMAHGSSMAGMGWFAAVYEMTWSGPPPMVRTPYSSERKVVVVPMRDAMN